MKRFNALALSTIATCAIVSAGTPAWSQSWPEVFDPLVVRNLSLEITPADWDTIRFDLTNEIEVPASLSADGEAPILVSVRRKSSRALPSETDPQKIGLKIDINEYVDGQLWHGLAKLSLENGGDVSVIYEGMAWQLHELASQAGFYGPEEHAALANWVTVSVNGAPLGVYTSVEQRDSQFLRNRGVRVKGQTWLYEVDDIDGWAVEDGDPHSPAFQALCYSPFRPVAKKGGSGTCSTPSDAVLATHLDSLIEVDAMLAQGAVDAFSANPDALFSHGKNFMFADFSHSGLKRRYYPWDLDAVFRSTSTGIYGDIGKRGVTQTPYEKVLLNHPELRARFNAILSAMIAPGGPLATSSVALLDAIEPVLAPALLADPYASVDATSAFNQLRNWIPARVGNVQSQIGANGPPSPR
jgi:hypothetical protein